MCQLISSRCFKMKLVFYVFITFIISCNLKEEASSNKKYSDIFGKYHSDESYFDYQEALLEAKRQKKPLLIIFCGLGAYYTKVLESEIISNHKINNYIKENFVLVNLYVDDRTLLPENEWKKSERDKKWLKTIGAQNNEIQTLKFRQGAQPYIVVLDSSQKIILDKQSDYLDKDRMFAFFNKANNIYKESLSYQNKNQGIPPLKPTD